ncbi:glycosyltransferase [Deinococcus sp. VB142]|uniref:Glycosyltransferase n=1 Tax=Deinococcus sp. VB142 TaxID=3112952 RepID=A0AAU6PZA4_9DEIO
MISVTLISYNSPEVTIEAIGSIIKSLEKYNIDGEIIVVDNNSTENNVKLIEKIFPNVALICLDENIGFARAHNLALQKTRGKYVFIANSDVVLRDNVFGNSIEKFEHDPDLAAIGPLVYEKDGSMASTSRDFVFYSLLSTMLSVANAVFPLATRAESQHMPKFLKNTIFKNHESVNPIFESRYVDWIDGMFVGFRRSFLERIGLFDSFYFFDHEIGDILNRLRDAGGSIYFDTSQSITHLGGHSRKRNPKIIRASLIGYIHYIYNNRKDYFYPIAFEICILSYLRSIYARAIRNSSDHELWHAISSEALSYIRKPIKREYTIPQLGEVQ